MMMPLGPLTTSAPTDRQPTVINVSEYIQDQLILFHSLTYLQAQLRPAKIGLDQKNCQAELWATYMIAGLRY